MFMYCVYVIKNYMHFPLNEKDMDISPNWECAVLGGEKKRSNLEP